ncbi:MAG: methyltransferase [Ignavibacteria bacterium]|nr:methyltransferase [Ignavibacteria bacterium]
MERIVFEKVKKFSFTIRPTVFNPNDYYSSKIFASYINSMEVEGKNILDMGSGSGIVSIFAASKGAFCTAVDNNPVAVKCINENIIQNHFTKKITAIESDLFESKQLENKKFDVIFFNPPYYKGIPKNNFETAFKGGNNLEVIQRFLASSKNYLLKNGIIIFIVSSDMDIDEFFNMLNTAGYNYKILTTNKKYFETFYIIEAVIN